MGKQDKPDEWTLIKQQQQDNLENARKIAKKAADEAYKKTLENAFKIKELKQGRHH